MKTCLNTATTRGYPLEEDIRYCGHFGFEGIEIDTDKLDAYLESNSVDQLKRLLDGWGLACAALMAFPFYPFGDRTAALDKVRKYTPICKALGAPTLLCYIAEAGPEGMAPAEAVEVAGAVAREYAYVADGLQIALEAIGGAKFMRRPEDALAIAEAADHPMAGYMIDTFHGYKAGLMPADIAGLRAERLFIVHINDCEDLPREQLTDANRLYTGLGIIPLNEYIWSLKGLGYDGFLSVEIFREEYWQDSHENIIRNALEHLKATMAAVG